MNKIVIYQVLVRLFHGQMDQQDTQAKRGAEKWYAIPNDNVSRADATNSKGNPEFPACLAGGERWPVPNGTIEQNGCGKMNNFTLSILKQLRSAGFTHIWYTGLLAHATQTDYSKYGIRRDHRAMVKGRAGSPYAVKDYYDIDPDLASRPDKRREEFMQLVERTHKAGLKVVMDFVPNHVARKYGASGNDCLKTNNKHKQKEKSSALIDNWRPVGVRELGQDDNPSQAFSQSNNYYYIPGQRLQCQFDMQGVETTPYVEYPAKATGNDCFNARPSRNDWYETVKLNYGVDYVGGGRKYFDPIPNTWTKMLDILLFWADKGVDAFRCDMAEMVPVEFWDWALRQVKEKHPNVEFIGEVYNPSLYREYINHGRFDYLYDKVGLYDTLRSVIRMEQSAYQISWCWQSVDDIRPHMLYFLENHDEQRVASDFFAGEGKKGIPAMAVIMLMGINPAMVYFGQMLGEKGMDEEGFSGRDGRTTIFDYWSVPSMRGLLEKGRIKLVHASKEQRLLLDNYLALIRLATTEDVFASSNFFDLMYANMDNPQLDKNRVYAFLRFNNEERALVVCNFSDNADEVAVNIPAHAVDYMKMEESTYRVEPLLGDTPKSASALSPVDGGRITVGVSPWGVTIVKILNPKH